MTDIAPPISPLTLFSSAERMFPILTPAQVKRIAAHGVLRSILPGEVLIEAGARVVPFFVVTAGRLEIVRPSGTGETLVTVHGPGQFTGEVNMLSGRPALVRSRASEAGEVIELDREQLAGAGADRHRARRDPHARLHPAPGGADRAAGSATSCSSARIIAPGRCASRSS